MVKKNQVLLIVFVIIFTLLSLRLMQLQLAQYSKYSSLAVENAAKTVPERAPRGIIYDRFGKVIVENRPVFSVRVLPYVLAAKSEIERDRILSKLESLLGEKIDIKVSATEPLVVKNNVPLKIAIQIEEKKQELPGVVVTSRPVRLYPFENLASHLLGFVGEIEAKELKTMRREGYRMGDIVGKDGVERIYDKLIRGRDGGKKVEVDVKGTPIRIIESIDPESGADMRLTIDLEMQKVAEAALRPYKEGAVVVMNVKTGEILALASYPNFDPNVFADPFSNWKWKNVERGNHPFMNRALGIYPPGSIFKVITLIAALEEGKAKPDEVMNCPGYYRVLNRYAKCWLEGGHGPVTVKEGLTWSCDIVFYELGKRLGPDLIAKYAKKFGLGSYSGIDLPQEKMGSVPTSKWKKKYLKEPWYAGDSINYGIGQGFLQVTPLQMAVLYASIATGRIVKPYVVDEIKDKKGKILYESTIEILDDIPVSKENLKIVREALFDVIDRATGVAVRFSGVPAAGKTGTAENPGKAHAWFICYAPFDNPEIVIASFVAHGEHGDRASAYVARDILKWYKEHRLARKVEVKPYAGQYIWHGSRKVPYHTLRRPAPYRTVPGPAPYRTVPGPAAAVSPKEKKNTEE